ncbi:aminotransferase class IV family protein [Ruegeria arenilitoris]|uniref:Probable branched-chain-amino-acid aminotransferase n=1 Tax=Ruegeria arenilitoris TaxID=1173585 RepID=A0A238KYG9_9RHOB|nr:aminotransferase class IV family protein [Ruegeria arenilitoris]SMX47767.1 putative branched-chain-amino-acid aminotransferase [Ruegeria arenilitoris]
MESPVRAPTEPDFRLIETFAFRPGQGFVRLERHLRRMARTADWLGVRFDVRRVGEVVDGVSGANPLRCRLTLDLTGAPEITMGPLADNPPDWTVGLATTRLTSSDIWLRHKTTRRAIYDQARAELPDVVDELLFLNERDELCEGTITNLFVETENGCLLTPPVAAGLLPGILREELLETGRAAEAVLTLHDLAAAHRVWMGNSLRGLIPAQAMLP